jgi:hypothetical protein
LPVSLQGFDAAERRFQSVRGLPLPLSFAKHPFRRRPGFLACDFPVTRSLTGCHALIGVT